MSKPIKFNVGYLVDVAALATAGALVMWLKSRQEKYFPILLGCMGATIALLAVYYFLSDTKVTNKSGGMAFIKPEESTKPQELQQGKSVYGVDGIKSKGKVYKIVDGTHATITDTGIKVHSFTAKLLNAVMGSVRIPLSSPPAPDWQNLFEK